MSIKKLLLSLLFSLFFCSVSFAQGVNIDNKKDTLYHDYRFNLLVGTSHGINKMEIGLLINIDRKNVQHVQIAGLGNFVKGSLTGCQLAGFMNTTPGKTKGLQAAGFGNNAGNVNGMQAAGFYNYALDFSGVQVAGFLCYTHTINGLQGAGFLNYARTMNGVQAAGFLNYAKTMACTQLAGFLNYAKTVTKGVQIAPFNYADSSRGTPVGFLSYVRHGGYHNVEVSADEVFYTNLAIRTGVRQFYNILTIGIRPSGGSNMLWTYGYGVGTIYSISKKIDMNIDITYNHIDFGTAKLPEYLSNAYKLCTGFNYLLAKKISLSIGPTLNVFIVSQSNTDLINAFDNITLPYVYKHIFNTNDGNSSYLKAWVGGKIAVRFL